MLPKRKRADMESAPTILWKYIYFFCADCRMEIKKMKKIGIVPAAKLDAVENIWDNIYRIVTTYPTRIYEQGGIPIGLLPNVDQYSEELLDMVDGILICGGTQFFDYQFQAIDHAVKHGKPLLGICLGMQLINNYFTVKAEAEKRGYTGSLRRFAEVASIRFFHVFTILSLPSHRRDGLLSFLRTIRIVSQVGARSQL